MSAYCINPLRTIPLARRTFGVHDYHSVGPENYCPHHSQHSRRRSQGGNDMNPQEARTMVDTFEAAHPDVYQLAKAVSIAVRVEPELLRRVRLQLLPEIYAGAEADLWFSALVQSQTPLAMTFIPEVVDVLRATL